MLTNVTFMLKMGATTYIINVGSNKLYITGAF